MAEPLLNLTEVNPSPKTPRRKRRTELVQPEVLPAELGTLRNALQAVEEVELRVTPGRWEYQVQVLFAFAFHDFKLFTSLAGIGISRALYAFGVLPRSGL
jgi:hypothetical protein